MDTLVDFLRTHARKDVLSLDVLASAAHRYDLTHAAVEEAALEMGLLPARYRRNRLALPIESQLRLFRSHAAVIGCGGLGGYAIETLARLGIGQITTVDPDTFEDHNLNRQVLATILRLGKPKTIAAAQRVREINPAVTVHPVNESFSTENGAKLLKDVNVVVDALDSIPARLELAKVCGDLDIPMVHGSIAGWYGQVLTQFPGDGTVETLYGNYREERGIERQVGNLSFTPAVVANIQAAEVCKIILEKGHTLRYKMLVVNLMDMDMQTVEF